MIYYSLFQSHLNYCPLTWMPSLKKSEKVQLFKLQKRAVRALFDAPFNSHTKNMFQISGIIPVTHLFEYHSATFVKKHLELGQPELIHDILPIQENRQKLKYPRGTKPGNVFFDIVKCWFNTDPVIKKAETLNSFKNKLKESITQSYYTSNNDCTKKECIWCKNSSHCRLLAYTKKW